MAKRMTKDIRMNRRQAVCALHLGNRIALSFWEETYLYLDNDGSVRNHLGNIMYPDPYDFFHAGQWGGDDGNWIIYKEKRETKPKFIRFELEDG